MGAGFDIDEKGIEFYSTGTLNGGLHLETDVHPGFMTDWQQPLMVLLTQAKGTSVLHETVYENRFGFLKTIQEMGGQLHVSDHCLGHPCRFHGKGFEHSAIVHGPTLLKAKEIHVPDLRAGFAYIMAALIAEGTSHVWGLHYLERGYPHLIETLQMLGAKVEKITSASDNSVTTLQNLQTVTLNQPVLA
jgi:UDP-N-acetylglucosamine 1-carboxyvinyltransferase